MTQAVDLPKKNGSAGRTDPINVATAMTIALRRLR